MFEGQPRDRVERAPVTANVALLVFERKIARPNEGFLRGLRFECGREMLAEPRCAAIDAGSVDIFEDGLAIGHSRDMRCEIPHKWFYLRVCPQSE